MVKFQPSGCRRCACLLGFGGFIFTQPGMFVPCIVTRCGQPIPYIYNSDNELLYFSEVPKSIAFSLDQLGFIKLLSKSKEILA